MGSAFRCGGCLAHLGADLRGVALREIVYLLEEEVDRDIKAIGSGMVMSVVVENMGGHGASLGRYISFPGMRLAT